MSDTLTQILEDLADFSQDPLGFVLYAFPWGEEGTELAKKTGPEPWQVDLLRSIGSGLLSLDKAVQQAVASGHGIGKSALVSWIILWSISTFPDTRGVVTANTENQLKTKTWVELDKWYRLFIGRDFFEKSATRICSRDPEHAESWRIDMVPWSERNTEAFAGLHNLGKRVVLIYDEASAIPDIIWETSEGVLTDANTQIIWLVCGNPTKNSGRFKDCFPGGKHANAWTSRCVDSREVSISNKSQIALWEESYGEDSDFFRVRVRGAFPRQGAEEFISAEDVNLAMNRELIPDNLAGLVMGVDVARYGDDETVIYFRQGRDARSIEPVILRGANTVEVAQRVADLSRIHNPDAICIDGGGVGGGVIDQLRQLRIHCFEIQFGSSPSRLNLDGDNTSYANKRAEMWGTLRSALRSGLCIPQDEELRSQLVGPTYGFNNRDEIQLESKKDMRARGVASPDRADALALTYAVYVPPRSLGDILKPKIEMEYDLYAEFA